nr:MAG TPA: hypothetical protein [Caudoviricetes sp.]
MESTYIPDWQILPEINKPVIEQIWIAGTF